REKVKAGLTGYAQIEGKYNTVPEDKLMLDLMYIENFSLFNDMRLLFRTFTVLFRTDSTEGFARKESSGNERTRQSKRKKKAQH
ncbi:MAG: sugar transferase, partial [Clostridiales bacterium]|nr:sugar transferase [Clostridiales bacterium]